MPNYAICDHGQIEAKIIPEECFAAPGFCPEGIYHTFFRHDNYVGLLEQRMAYFAQQIRICYGLGQDAYRLIQPLLNSNDISNLLKTENLRDRPAKIRMMLFAEPLALADGRFTTTLMIATEASAPAEPTNSFRCAVIQRPSTGDGSGIVPKLLGRRRIDDDLAKARSQGFDDVLYLNRQGHWGEASYANICAVFGKKIVRVMPVGEYYIGMTTKALELVKKEIRPFQIHDGTIDKMEIADADEVFLTSAVRGLQPVSEIEGVGKWSVNSSDSVCARLRKELTVKKII